MTNTAIEIVLMAEFVGLCLFGLRCLLQQQKYVEAMKTYDLDLWIRFFPGGHGRAGWPLLEHVLKGPEENRLLEIKRKDFFNSLVYLVVGIATFLLTVLVCSLITQYRV